MQHRESVDVRIVRDRCNCSPLVESDDTVNDALKLLEARIETYERRIATYRIAIVALRESGPEAKG